MKPFVVRRAPRRLSRLIPLAVSLPPIIIASQYVSTHALPGGARLWVLGSFTLGLLLSLVRIVYGRIARDPQGAAARSVIATWVTYDLVIGLAWSVQLFGMLASFRGGALDPWQVLGEMSVPLPGLAGFVVLVPLLSAWLYTLYQSRAQSFDRGVLGVGAMALILGTAPVWIYLAANALSLASPIHLLSVDELQGLARGVGAILATGSALGCLLVAYDLVLGLRGPPAARLTA